MRRRLLATALLLSGGSVSAALPAHAAGQQIFGVGASAVSGIVGQWSADLSGSGPDVIWDGDDQAHADFAAGFVDFAIDSVPYLGTDPDGSPDTSNGRALTYAPLVGETVAFDYHLDRRGDPVKDVRLSPRTLIGMLTGRITRWDDPAITRDNHGHALPSRPITPVVASGPSEVTYQLTSWLSDRFPHAWASYAGSPGPMTAFPVPADGVAADPSAVVDDVTATEGAFTFLPGSQGTRSALPLALVRNAAGFFVRPSGIGASLALRAATVGADHVPVLTAVYDDPDPRAYPATYVDSMFVPLDPHDPHENASRRQALADLAQHALCDQAQYAAPEAYAPLPLALVRPALQQVRRLGAIDPFVDVSHDDVAHCRSALIGHAPLRDLLPERIWMPRPCDRADAGPCPTAAPLHTRHCFSWRGARTCATLAFSRSAPPVARAVVDNLRPGRQEVQLRRLRLSVDQSRPDGRPVAPTRRAADADGWHHGSDAVALTGRDEYCPRFVLRGRVGVREGSVTHWVTRSLVAAYDGSSGCP